MRHERSTRVLYDSIGYSMSRLTAVGRTRGHGRGAIQGTGVQGRGARRVACLACRAARAGAALAEGVQRRQRGRPGAYVVTVKPYSARRVRLRVL